MAAYYYEIDHPATEILTLPQAIKQLKLEDLGGFDDDLVKECIVASIQEAENYINANIVERRFIVKSDCWLQDFEFSKQNIQKVDKIIYKPADGGDVVELIDLPLSDFMELLPIDKYAHKIHLKDENLPDLLDGVNDAVSIEITVGYPTGKVPAAIKQGIKLLITENYTYRGDREKRNHTVAQAKLEPYKYYPTPSE